MKSLLKVMILILIPTVAILIKPAVSVFAATSAQEMTNHIGQKVMVSGTAKGKAWWKVTDGAQSYNVYIKVCGNPHFVGAVTVPGSGQSVEIGYLNPVLRYCYQAVPIVDGKELWNKNPEKTLRQPDNSYHVLGAQTSFDTTNGYQANPYYPNQANTPMYYNDYKQAHNYNNNLEQPYAPDAQKDLSWNRTYPDTQENDYLAQGSTYYPNQNMTNTGGTTVSMNNPTSMTVSWVEKPTVNLKEIHVYYWSSSTDKHAVRGLPENAKQVKINYLKSNRSYSYMVQGIRYDGSAYTIK